MTNAGSIAGGTGLCNHASWHFF